MVNNQFYSYILNLGEKQLLSFQARKIPTSSIKNFIIAVMQWTKLHLKVLKPTSQEEFKRYAYQEQSKKKGWFPCSETEWLLDDTSHPYSLHFFNHTRCCLESLTISVLICGFSDKQRSLLVNYWPVQLAVINNHLENLAYFSDNSLLIYIDKNRLPTH